jgi:parvulin-like peptidyl-prolyl isomerase
VKSKVLKAKLSIVGAAIVAVSLFSIGCGGNSGSFNPDETAASVNGVAIKMEAVERALKQQAQGQEANLSPLDLASARLTILQNLIEEEVMFQKAQAEGTVPTDDEINAEFNKLRTDSKLSKEEFEKKMAEVGETEVSMKDRLKKSLAIQKLSDKISSRVEPPKDSEVEAFFNSNKELFKNRRGAQLAAIVIDPSLSANGKTRTDAEMAEKLGVVGQKLNQGVDFAQVAGEESEEQSTRVGGGSWRYFTEDELKQVFGPQIADAIMNRMQNGQLFPSPLQFEGKYLIVKLQRKQESDEDRTLETPGVKQEIADVLVNNRKRLLTASYQAIALSEAKVENFLAKKVVENPNELSGARPAPVATPTPAATATPVASPVASPAAPSPAAKK